MISVVINTYNAERYLSKCLDAVKDFDEIVVCDMESTDHTRDIAKKYGCRIITFPKGSHKIVEPARDFAIHQVSNSWTLVVDADEIVTAPLREKLIELALSDNNVDGYYISRHNMVMGKYCRNSGHDYILRFFRQEKTTWAPTIHSLPQVTGHIERLPKKYEILHLADENMQAWVRKMNDYTDYEVARKAERNFGVAALFTRPLWRFLKNYFMMGGFLNGKRGLLQAVQWSVYQQVLITKIIEKKLRENEKDIPYRLQ